MVAVIVVLVLAVVASSPRPELAHKFLRAGGDKSRSSRLGSEMQSVGRKPGRGK